MSVQRSIQVSPTQRHFYCHFPSKLSLCHEKMNRYEIEWIVRSKANLTCSGGATASVAVAVSALELEKVVMEH